MQETTIYLDRIFLTPFSVGSPEEHILFHLGRYGLKAKVRVEDLHVMVSTPEPEKVYSFLSGLGYRRVA